jgi:hypothetical protein
MHAIKTKVVIVLQSLARHLSFFVSHMKHIIDAEFSYQVFAGAVLGFAVATFTGMMAGLGNSG